MEKATKFVYIFLLCILILKGLASEETSEDQKNKNTVYSDRSCKPENSGTPIKLIEMLFDQQTELLKFKSMKAEEMLQQFGVLKESLKTLEERHANDVKRLETLEQKYVNDVKRLETLEQKHVNDVKRLETEIKTLPSKQRPNVAFHARVSPSYRDLIPDQTILFRDVMTNLGNHYNPNTGIFQAPVSGTYVFSCTVMSTSAVEVRLLLNNSYKMYVYPDARGKDAWDTSSNSVILHLQKGDQVRMTKNGSHGKRPFYIHNVFSTFSGFLIHV